MNKTYIGTINDIRVGTIERALNFIFFESNAKNCSHDDIFERNLNFCREFDDSIDGTTMRMKSVDRLGFCSCDGKSEGAVYQRQFLSV